MCGWNFLFFHNRVFILNNKYLLRLFGEQPHHNVNAQPDLYLTVTQCGS
uniref:Uncharacterized protein n=1 Tax=Anguilla anguilla TaxID=7936 RepID=A0A0E9VGZ7_ANGAN